MRNTEDPSEARLKEPDFIRAVVALMREEKVCNMFALFDEDGSGSIDSMELEKLVTMVNPHQPKGELTDLCRKLDLNGDGTVDMWEFCVQLQLRREKLSEAEGKLEVDIAFDRVFTPDAQGFISTQELRRVFTLESAGLALNEAEFDEMLADIGVREGGQILLEDLRKHPSFL